MKRTDPEVTKRRDAMRRASLHADILLKGFCRELENSYIEGVEDLAEFVDYLNGPVMKAVQEFDRANAEYLKVARRRLHRFARRRAA